MEVIRHDSRQILLPRQMTIIEAIEWLQTALQEEETEVQFHREFNVLPVDGAYQVFEAIKTVFGFSQVKKAGMFEEPPKYISILLRDGTTVEVPWGKMIFPGIEGYVASGQATGDWGVNRLVLKGLFKRRSQPKVEELAKEIQRRIDRGMSIYRGQTLDSHTMDLSVLPKIEKDRLVLHNEARRRLEAHLWQIIKNPGVLKNHGVQPKRAILLKGAYGTGKSLTALVTAQLATQAGMTFIMAEDADEAFGALELARMYQPSVVFIEDIDRLVNIDEDNTSRMIKFREQVDGVLSKDAQIMLVMTTNFPDKIHESFRRTGRIDVVVDFPLPDVEMSRQLLQINLEQCKVEDDALDIGAMACEGLIPSLVASVADRSKVYAIQRTPRARQLKISGDDIISAAVELHEHQEFINRAEPEDEMAKINRAVEVVRSSPMGRLFMHESTASVGTVSSHDDNMETESQTTRDRVSVDGSETREQNEDLAKKLGALIQKVPAVTATMVKNDR
jgi:transitional endoplasmic reticulum ATPase